MKLELPAGVRTIVDALRARGGRPFIVGGAVRDAAAGIVPKDFDVEVFGLGVDALVEALDPVGKVHTVGRSFGVVKVVVGGSETDVALPRRESKRGRGHKGFVVEPDADLEPRDAASRRDFTINAMSYDPFSKEVRDYFGGLRDLESRTLRHTAPAFAEDPLRVLRGMQLAGRFELTAAPETVELSRSLFAEYDTLAAERIWGEWLKWAARSTAPARGLEFLRRCGWDEAYPELRALVGCPQEPEWHPEGDVWTHTLLVTERAAGIAEREGLPVAERAVLVLSALGHDLGKPETTFADDDGRIRSPGHAERVETIERFLSRIACPQNLAERVVTLCRFHLRHMGYRGSDRHVRRLSRALDDGGETIESLARLVEADHSARPPLPGGMPPEMRAILEHAARMHVDRSAPRPLLMGRHLLERGIEPGPEMGATLDAAYQAQLDGDFADLEGALAWLEKRRG